MVKPKFPKSTIVKFHCTTYLPNSCMRFMHVDPSIGAVGREHAVVLLATRTR